jgi:hypothetical protein
MAEIQEQKLFERSFMHCKNGIQKSFELMENTQCLGRYLKCKVLWTILNPTVEKCTNNMSSATRQMKYFNEEIKRTFLSYLQYSKFSMYF